MDLKFDPDSAAANRQEHGVSVSHTEQALRDPRALTIEDPDAHGEQRFVSLGMASLGRILVVVHARRAERTHLVSAREASPEEARQYHA